MYVGVDVGGTKTLLAVLTDRGEIVESRRFPTPLEYRTFLLELKHAVTQLEHQDFLAGGIGIPGNIDRRHGIGRRFGNLPWHDVHALADAERILGCPLVLENDAKLAALSEAMLRKGKQRLLYVTISTGIGYALVVDGQIDINLNDAGGADMLLEHGGKLVPWESFASGKAIVARYGKRAEDIHDEATWHRIVRDLRSGLLELIAITTPDVIVIGGSVGRYFERYHQLLVNDLKPFETPLLHIPVFEEAKRPEEAVIFGCYDLAKQTFSPANQPAAKRKAGHAKAA